MQLIQVALPQDRVCVQMAKHVENSGAASSQSSHPIGEALTAFVNQLGRNCIGGIGIDPADLNIIESNSQFAEFVGVKRDELFGVNLSELLPEIADSGMVEDIASLASGEQERFQRTLFVQGEDRSSRWIQTTFAMWDGAGDDDVDNVVVATAVDISAAVTAEQEREQTLQRMEMAQRHSQVGCWELVKGETVGWWSRQLFEMFGLSPNQAPPTFEQFLELVHPDDRQSIVEYHQTELRLNGSIEIEFRRNPEIGETRWFHAQVKAFQRGDETVWFGTTQDVTQRHQMESAIIASEKIYREIVETASEGLTMVDTEGKIIKTNQVAANMFGYEPEELVGKGIFEMIGETSRDDLSENFKKRADGIAEAVEYRVKHRDGHELWVLVSSHPLFDENGTFTGTRNVVLNITHRKIAEELARKADVAQAKLAMLSERERDVFALVVEGLMNKVIARRLDVSEKTVERHRSNLMKKLGVRGVAELVRIAMDAESIRR
ncbi:PAS domain S-box protein [Rhodopirellula sallentina]|uniref:histidine kinase n=1 Tax=Rhodopirellula sallentina SM41 TaxID=1263870 RepID=M5U8Q5_9BACT|nr:PAS domain S-box protein [Rhodopirellula sallentina]EMI52348.1 PAS protein [Rhodopirellula sallentina SM41]